MNDNKPDAITDIRILAALRAVNPPLEQLMSDRLALRQDIKRTRGELDTERRRLAELRKLRDVMIPRYIGVAKVITLAAATIGLIALATAFFSGLLETGTTASLFASLLLPLWLVELAERRFGRWEVCIMPMCGVKFRHVGVSGIG